MLFDVIWVAFQSLPRLFVLQAPNSRLSPGLEYIHTHRHHPSGRALQRSRPPPQKALDPEEMRLDQLLLV